MLFCIGAKGETIMKFEVKRNTQTLFFTEHVECIPSPEELREMSKSGHTFALDGRRISLDKAINFVKK